MRVFITGAASPLGQSLTRLLVERGHVVTGQVRRSTGIAVLRELGAEPVIEDLLRPASLIGVMQACDLVFHLAHFFDFWAPDSTTYHSVNISGTEAVMTSALVARVPRLVFCSSALAGCDGHGGHGATGVTKGNGIARRGRGRRGRRTRPANTAFARSMGTAEDLALRYVAKGVDVVVARPSIVLAPSDPGWAGRLMADRVAGRRRFASQAPIGWIWVDDAARALALAAERGACGSRYTFSGAAASQRALLSEVSRLAGLSGPGPLPRAVALAMAAMGAPIARIEQRRPVLPMDEARFISAGLDVNGDAAATAIGCEYTPMSTYLPSVVRSYAA